MLFRFDFIIKVESFDCDMGQMLNIINNKTAAVTVSNLLKTWKSLSYRDVFSPIEVS